MHDIAEGKTAGRTKTAKSAAWRACAAGKAQPTGPSGCLGAIFTYAVRHRMRTGQPGARRHAVRGRQARAAAER